jgi:putative transcriptional regulator
MPLAYKINVLEALKQAGYTTYRLRSEKLIAEASLQKIRKGEIVGAVNLETICKLLNCQPGDILQYVQEDHA